MLKIQLPPEHSENNAMQKTFEVPSSVPVPRDTQKYAVIFNLISYGNKMYVCNLYMCLRMFCVSQSPSFINNPTVQILLEREEESYCQFWLT